MILMAMANISSEIIGIVVSVSALTPLVKALYRWHIDIRKMSKPVITTTILHAQTSVPRSRFWMFTGFFIMVLTQVCLWTIVFLVPETPATTRQVALVGALVAAYVAALNIIREA
jgi:hypothetical protein